MFSSPGSIVTARFIAGLAAFFSLELAVLSAVGDDGKFAKKSQALSAKRQALIDKELQTLKGHPWAGDYYYGDGLGVNVDLRLAPKSGFVFTWHGCLGLYDLNYGEVIDEGGRIKFVFRFSHEQEGFQGLAPEMLPVSWGERHYLVSANGALDFVNDINAGIEPRKTVHGRYLLRRSDEQKPASGQPALPSEYSVYLLTYPIDAEISSIEANRTEKTRHVASVRLNVGIADGVKPGMKFYVYVPSAIYQSARIVAVDASYSEAEIIQDDEFDSKAPRPVVGWKLSTLLGRGLGTELDGGDPLPRPNQAPLAQQNQPPSH